MGGKIYISEGENKMSQSSHQNVEQYPLILKAEHICEILGISKPTAYELMKHKDFPALDIPGRIKRVQREDFFGWLDGITRGKTNVVQAERG